MAVVEPVVPAEPAAPVADDRPHGRLEAELAEARSQAALPDPRTQAALRALAGVAEALEQPMRVAPAFRAAAERLGSALGFDAAVTLAPGARRRDGLLVGLGGEPGRSRVRGRVLADPAGAGGRSCPGTPTRRRPTACARS